MRHFLLIWAALVLPTAVCTAEPPKRSQAPTEFTDTRFARRLEVDVAAIERSEPQGWRDLAGCAYHVDGEYGEVFSSACAYLLRRDPTLFLRRHLAGDPDAMFCAWAGYGWSTDYRAVLDTVYQYRLLDARTSGERRKIREFIARTRDFNRVPPRPNSNCDLQAAVWREVLSRLLRWSSSFRMTAVSATLAGLPLALRCW